MYQFLDEQRTCSECNRLHDSSDFEEIYDRYGIYFKRVCYHCAPRVQAEIDRWRFDAGDAGESLEEDY